MTKEKKKEYLVISFLPFIMLVYSVILTNPSDLIKGMKHILLSDGVLLTDYFVVGGKGASMFNASVVAVFIVNVSPCFSSVAPLYVNPLFGVNDTPVDCF